MKHIYARGRRAVALAGIVAAGCVGGKAELTAIVAPDQALGSIAVIPTAMILAVGETRQLSITGATLTGAPVTSFDTVFYVRTTAADSARYGLEDGLITARSAGNLMLLNVIARRDGQYQADQVILQTTATSVPGATLSIQPVAPDSTKLAAGSIRTMTPVVRNATTGLGVSSPVVRYSVKPADALRVSLYRPAISFGGFTLTRATAPAPTSSQIAALASEGSAWVYGTVDAYGTVLRDSVLISFSYAYAATIRVVTAGAGIASVVASVPGQNYSPIVENPTNTLAPGATVTFRNNNPAVDPVTFEFTFTNPAAAVAASPASTVGGASGNVTALSAAQQSNRRFMAPGTYPWTATAVGGPAPWVGQSVSGTIVIK